MSNNNLWCYNKVEPFLGRKILELGSGIGRISKYLVRKDREVTLLDIDKEYTNYLRKRFISNPGVRIVEADILKVDEVLTDRNFDTVVGINILEHVNNDVEAVERLKKIITATGRLVLIVPAHKVLFSNFDKRVGHYRRYSKKELQDKLLKGGFFIEKIEFMNVLGPIGWFLQFRLLKRKRMSKTTIQFFDKLVPLIALIEKYVRFPFGLSLLCVARSK
ncbi:class I SAM-dependent methyltransferase [bacterium]|nr:class I SAM-dependent methyltransferase [bacterium]